MATVAYYYNMHTLTKEDFSWLIETFEGRVTIHVTTDTMEISTINGGKMRIPKNIDNEVRIVTEEDRAVFLLRYPDASLTEMEHLPDAV